MRKLITYFGTLLGGHSVIGQDMFRNVSGVAAARLVGIAIAFISSVLLARVLGPEKYGAYVFSIALMTSLALFSCMGAPALIVREVAKYMQFNQYGLIRGLFRSSHQLVICASGASILLVVAVGLYFDIEMERSRWWLILISLPLVPLISLSYLRASFLSGMNKVALGVIPDLVVRPIVFLILVCGLLQLGEVAVGSVILIQIVACVSSLVVGLFIYKNMTAGEIKKAIPDYRRREWVSAITPFMGIAGVSFLNVEFVDIFLGISATNTDMAIFRAAANLGLVVALPLAIIESVVLPRITQVYQSGNQELLQSLAKGASVVAFWVSLVPALILLFYGSELISFIYGDEYAQGYSALIAIVIGYMLVNLIGLPMQLLYATKYQVAAFRVSALGAVVTIVLCIILIPSFGALGAGIVLGLGKVLRTVLFAIEVRRRLSIRFSMFGLRVPLI